MKPKKNILPVLFFSSTHDDLFLPLENREDTQPFSLLDQNHAHSLNLLITSLKGQGLEKFALIGIDPPTQNNGQDFIKLPEVPYESRPLSLELLKKSLLALPFENFIFINVFNHFDTDWKYFLNFVEEKPVVGLNYNPPDVSLPMAKKQFHHLIFDQDGKIDFPTQEHQQHHFDDSFSACGIFSISKKTLQSLTISQTCFALTHFKGLPLGGKILSRSSKNTLERRPCLFLDRDGVLIKDQKYLHHPDQVILCTEIIPILQWAKENNYLCLVISNQSGLGRGMFNQDQLNLVTQRIDQLLKDYSLKIDHWYFSIFHPTEGKGMYRKNTLCRKPYPGMILKAMADYSIDLQRSFMIGDKDSDVIILPHLKSYLIQGDYPLTNVKERNIIFSNLTALFSELKISQVEDRENGPKKPQSVN